MQVWELIRRLLINTDSGRTFTPGLVADKYLKELEIAGCSDLPSTSEIKELAQDLVEELESAGLIQPAPKKTGSNAAILDAKVLTEFGDELSRVLAGMNVVELFESMQVDLERGAIQRVLHQLDS